MSLSKSYKTPINVPHNAYKGVWVGNSGSRLLILEFWWLSRTCSPHVCVICFDFINCAFFCEKMLKKPSLCHTVQIKGPFWKSFGYSSWEDLFLCTDCKKKNSELLICINCYNQLCYYFSLFVETINKHFWGVLIGSILK